MNLARFMRYTKQFALGCIAMIVTGTAGVVASAAGWDGWRDYFLVASTTIAIGLLLAGIALMLLDTADTTET